MTKRNSDKAKLSAKIFSGIFFLVGLAVLVYIGVSLGKETYRKRQIQKEIEGLQAEISALGRENGEMENMISYFSSQEFQEKELREKMNLQKSDEKMIVIRKDVVQPEKNEQDKTDNSRFAPVDNSPNWQKWWKFFFGSRG